MRIIYEPRGRAKEYAALALNLYTGCNHGCKYCYVKQFFNKDTNIFENKIVVKQDILKKVEKDCIELSQTGQVDRILLCFMCDPYQPIDEDLKITRKVLELFKKYNIRFQVLTKGGSRAERDFDLYKKGDAFATTLTFLSDEDSLHFEPNAQTPENRIGTIIKAKNLGIETWVSLEPVIYTEQSLDIIDITYSFVDKYKVGKINHFKHLEERTDWHLFVNQAINRLKKYKKNYYIKKDLAVYI